MILRPDVDTDFIEAVLGEFELDGTLFPPAADGRWRLVCREVEARDIRITLNAVIGWLATSQPVGFGKSVVWFEVPEGKKP